MLGNRAKGLGITLSTCFAFIAFLLFWSLAFLLIIFANFQLAGIDTYWTFSILIIGLIYVEYFVTSSSDLSRFLKFGIQTIRSTAKTLAIVAIGLMVYMFATKEVGMSRVFLGSYLALLFPSLYLAKEYLPPLLSKMLFNGRYRYKSILLGTADSNSKLEKWLQQNAQYGMQVVAADNEIDQSVRDEDFYELPELIQKTGAKILFLTTQIANESIMHNLQVLCESIGVRLVMVNSFSFGSSSRNRLSMYEDDGYYFVSIRKEPLECPVNRLLKRSLDLAISIPVVLLILPPAATVVWLIQRIHSPGRVLHRQARCGLHGEHFTMYKFRTMHQCAHDENKQATKNDTRIFSFGHFMRKSSLDELPQFINVLLGEMSIVGPRPHLPAHDIEFSKLASKYYLRNLVKPGITGLAQVRGHRGEVQVKGHILNRVSSDIFYAENWSLILDIGIILRTFMQMFKAPNTAY